MNDYRNCNLGDLLDALSVIVGIQNLQENRQQSAYNDVHKANDEQAEMLLNEIKTLFEKQKKEMDDIRKILNELGSNIWAIFNSLERIERGQRRRDLQEK